MRTVVLAALGLLVTMPSIPAQDQHSAGLGRQAVQRSDWSNSPRTRFRHRRQRGALLQHRFPITNIYAVPLHDHDRRLRATA